MTHNLFVKVCGMTRSSDVEALQRLGVDALGFIFVKKSPRRVTPEQAAALPHGPNKRVGLFLEHDVEETLRIMDRAKLDLAQLHGGQGPDFCRRIGPERVIKVFWPARYATRTALEADLTAYADAAALFLFDAGTSGGGHGVAQDFSRLAGLQSPRPWLLAGGLGPDNLAGALAETDPAGVDLNSGVEISPGVKDVEAVKRALEAAGRL